MSNKKQNAPRRRSKRDRRIRIAVFVMIIAMLLSTITSGLAFLI